MRQTASSFNKTMRPRPATLRLLVLASGLLFALCANAPHAPAQRRNTGAWDPSAPKSKPRPRPKPKPAPRPPAAPPKSRALAVQYRLLKVNDNDSQLEVSPVTVFHGGDRLRVAVKADDDVYVFVIHQKGPHQPGSIYFPDTRIGAQNHVSKGEQLVFPSNCAGNHSPSACSHLIDGRDGQEFFTLIFSRSESISLLEEANAAGGVVTPSALETYVGGLAQKFDASTRGDTVFARRFRNLNPRSADMVVVRLVLNKRG
ncbi:MAG: hypothetical protein ABW208_00980 [Pyrinomonadaceae bacterium]